MFTTRRTAKLLTLVAGAAMTLGIGVPAAHAIVPDPGITIGIPPIVDPCVIHPLICDPEFTTPTTDPTPPTTVPTPTTVPEGETGEPVPVPEAPPAVVVTATPNFTG